MVLGAGRPLAVRARTKRAAHHAVDVVSIVDAGDGLGELLEVAPDAGVTGASLHIGRRGERDVAVGLPEGEPIIHDRSRNGSEPKRAGEEGRWPSGSLS